MSEFAPIVVSWLAVILLSAIGFFVSSRGARQAHSEEVTTSRSSVPHPVTSLPAITTLAELIRRLDASSHNPSQKSRVCVPLHQGNKSFELQMHSERLELLQLLVNGELALDS